MSEAVKGLARYELEWLSPQGELLATQQVENITPLEGRNYIMNAAFGKTQQAQSFYIGLFEGDYVPSDNLKASTLQAEAVECTAYAAATRLPFTFEAATAGVVANTAQQAEFTFNASKTIYGAFISTVADKGSSAGAILSAVRFKAPEQASEGSVLRVRAGFSLVNT